MLCKRQFCKFLAFFRKMNHLVLIHADEACFNQLSDSDADGRLCYIQGLRDMNGAAMSLLLGDHEDCLQVIISGFIPEVSEYHVVPPFLSVPVVPLSG